MDPRLLEALANTVLLLLLALGLWLYWRRETRRFPDAFAPVPPLPDASIVAAGLVAERERTLARLNEAREGLERVAQAFKGGLRDGRRR